MLKLSLCVLIFNCSTNNNKYLIIEVVFCLLICYKSFHNILSISSKSFLVVSSSNLSCSLWAAFSSLITFYSQSCLNYQIILYSYKVHKKNVLISTIYHLLFITNRYHLDTKVGTNRYHTNNSFSSCGMGLGMCWL